MMSRFLLTLMMLVTVLPSMAGDVVDLQGLIRALDALYRSNTVHAEVVMSVETPHWKRILTMEMWGEGLKKTFIVIRNPRKDKGIATLRIDDEMWNYFPKIDKVMKVPPSMMMGSWMGSDFTNDDLVKESTFVDDYEAILRPPSSGEDSMYLLEFRPREQTVSVWGKILVFINKKNLLPVRQEYYDEKGERLRVMKFSEVRDFCGKQLPAVLELVPDNKPGHKTVIHYRSAMFDEPLESGLFTLRNLQRKRE